jgi:predicted amidohydrolase
MRVTIAQTDISLGDKDRNLVNARKIVAQAPSDLIFFPELFTTGFDCDILKELSEEVPGETTHTLRKVCGEILLEESDKEEILSCEVDVSLLKKIRGDFPVLGDSKIL